MVKLKRVYESSTKEVFAEILYLLKKEARVRGLVVGQPTLKSVTISDRKDPKREVTLSLNLMDSSAGEVIISLDNKTWKMGDTLIRDRSKSGGLKKPNMEAQVQNILDLVESKLATKRTNRGLFDLR